MLLLFILLFLLFMVFCVCVGEEVNKGIKNPLRLNEEGFFLFVMFGMLFCIVWRVFIYMVIVMVVCCKDLDRIKDDNNCFEKFEECVFDLDFVVFVFCYVYEYEKL